MEGRVTDTMIKPVRWMTQQAATGLKDLPRNSAWLLSKAVTAPSAKMRAAGDGITGSIYKLSVAAADQFPEARDTVEVRLKRAEAAIASAKQAERDALAEAQHVKALADAAKAAADEGEERIRHAVREAEQAVEGRMRDVRAHFAQLLDDERNKASREAAEAVERVSAEVRASVEKARGVAQAAAEMAQDRIRSAQQQMAEARSLGADAIAAAEQVADEAREKARAMAEAAQGLGSEGAGADIARRTEYPPTDETTVVVTRIE
jgi:hypothetical protein